MSNVDLFRLLASDVRWEVALLNLSEYSGEIARDWCRYGGALQFDCFDRGRQVRRILRNDGDLFNFTQLDHDGRSSYNMSVTIRPVVLVPVTVKNEVYPFEEV